MTLVSIPVEFFVDDICEPEELLDMLIGMEWLSYLRTNSAKIDSFKNYDPRTHRTIATYYFYLPEELASFYYLAHG